MQKINKLKKINIGGDLPLDYGFLRNKKNNDINFYNKKFNYSLNSGRAAIFLSLMIIKTKLKKFRAFLPYYCCPSIIQPFRELKIEVIYYGMGSGEASSIGTKNIRGHITMMVYEA